MKAAIVLVNMGGPSRRQDVEPFLRAIFRDPAILSLPSIVREPLASVIAARRAPHVADRYDLIGGYTPLFHWSGTLRAEVKRRIAADGDDSEVAYAFRYISPTIQETLTALKRKGVTVARIIPLFPHYTHTMTGSVLKETGRVAAKVGLEFVSVKDWGLDDDALRIWSRYLAAAMREAGVGARVLFVAHGIPQLYVNRGDDYPDRVSATATALAKTLPADTEWSLCYQSKVGPVKWTGPYLERELARLAASPAPLVVMPLSFVADCLETLYDLDIVAKRRAQELGITSFVRARVFNDESEFAAIIARLARELEHVA